jgi:hypothetical protein
MRARLLLALVMAAPLSARATTVPDVVSYTVEGFSPDRHVLFRKDDDGGGPCPEAWLAVYGPAGKLVVSVPVLRSANEECSGGGKHPITAAAGKRERAKLVQRFGGFTPGERLKREKKKGKKKNVLIGGGARVALEVQGKLPALPEDVEAK